MLSEKRSSMLYGVLLITLFSLAAFYTGDMGFVEGLPFSPMIAGIIPDMFYANSLRNNLPDIWAPGILFCSRHVLRIGIILYGLRLTFQNVTAVGSSTIPIDAIVATMAVCGGVLIGKLLKMDQGIALLASVGGDTYGVAAMLGARSVINTKPYKTAVAVSTAVIFNTLSMFLYPVLYRSGIFDLPPELMGLLTGSTVHEITHVAGAGNAMGRGVSNTVIIVKIIRVMILVPALLVISWTVTHNLTRHDSAEQVKGKITAPWFTILLSIVIGFNSFNPLPVTLVGRTNQFDTLLSIMAIAALGAEISFDKFKKAGARPFLLAAISFVWLIDSGYCLAKYVVPMLMNI